MFTNTNQFTPYKYNGIFTEIHKHIAANILIKYWRRCRYNPRYEMNNKIETDKLDTICIEEHVHIDITDYKYLKQFRLTLRQKDFKRDIELTKCVLREQKRLTDIINKRIILKGKRKYKNKHIFIIYSF